MDRPELFLDGLDIRNLDDLITILKSYKDTEINRDEMLKLMDHLKLSMMFWGVEGLHLTVSPKNLGISMDELNMMKERIK